MPIEFEILFSAEHSQLSIAAQSLIQDMKRIGNRRGVIPRAVQHRLPQSEDVSDDNFDQTGTLDGALFDRVLELCQLSGKCQKSDVMEPEWNCEVHNTAIRLGLTPRVCHHNVSAARIRDTSLLPSTAMKSKAKVMQSKMIDFALFVEADRALRERIRSKMIATGASGVNIFDYGFLRFEPMGVIFETKRSAVGEDEALAQLCLCACAHYARLRQLASAALDETSMPALPLIRVQGQAWIFLLAVPQADRSIVVYRELVIGSTGSVIEAYSVIAAVRRLAKWVDEVYRPWFVENCLDE